MHGHCKAPIPKIGELDETDVAFKMQQDVGRLDVPAMPGHRSLHMRWADAI